MSPRVSRFLGDGESIVHIGSSVLTLLKKDNGVSMWDGSFFVSPMDLTSSRKKERKKSLTRGHVNDIGSTVGIQPYWGQGYEGAKSGNCFENSRYL
jgi:hypothetical protein